MAMVHHPRWAEMCARILQQCEFLQGGRAKLAAFLDKLDGKKPDTEIGKSFL